MLPKGYTFLDPEDYDEAADRLAARYIRVGHDKEIEAIIGTDDDRPEVVAALFTGYNKEAFSFDVVVRHDHRRKGLARALVTLAVDQFDELSDGFDKDFHMEIDVVNPDMERLLKSMGFEVDKRFGKEHVQMTKPVSAIMQAVSEVVKVENKKKKKILRRDKIFQQGADFLKTKVPTFEELWADMLKGGRLADSARELMRDQATQEDFEDNTGLDPLNKKNHKAFFDWIVRTVYEPEQRHRYDETIWFLDQKLDGADCWRAMAISSRVNPVELEDLGIYWSTTEEGADVYGEPTSKIKNPVLVTYKARVDRQNVNLAATVRARMDLATGDDESEVTFIQGARIFVYEAKYKGKTLKINDWRHT